MNYISIVMQDTNCSFNVYCDCISLTRHHFDTFVYYVWGATVFIIYSASLYFLNSCSFKYHCVYDRGNVRWMYGSGGAISFSKLVRSSSVLSVEIWECQSGLFCCHLIHMCSDETDETISCLNIQDRFKSLFVICSLLLLLSSAIRSCLVSFIHLTS